jgi:glycosyltransferase involved in cell wall biosynthesis
MSKVLFHSLTIPPDNVSTGQLVADIAAELKLEGKQIEILASSPQYNFNNEIYENGTLEKLGKHLYVSEYNGVKIYHIHSNRRSFNREKRFLQWLSFHCKSIIFLYKNRHNYETVFIFSYPPTMNLVAILSKKLFKLKTIYSVWELYPEIAQKLNELNSKLLLSLFKKIDNYCLKIIDEVVVNSDELKLYLSRERNVNENKISVIYHFSNATASQKPEKISNHIIYTGNLGKPQNIQSFIEKLNKSTVAFKLTIYGSGSEYENILTFKSKFIEVNPYTIRSQIIDNTKEVPFALVSLSSEITVEGFPGKTFDYLKMNKILIGYSNPNSGLAKFIEEYKVGINIDPNTQSLDEELKKLDNKESLENFYKNIEKVNNNIANIKAVAQSYSDLI